MKIYFLAFVAIFLGCAPTQIKTIPVNVYNLTSSEVLRGEFYWTGLKGKVKLFKDNGQVCEGEYLTQMHGYTASGSSSTWGNIYKWGFMGGGAFSGTSTKVKILPNTNVGSAILVCPDENIIECEYIVNRDLHGSGFCKDKAGTRYKFMF